MDCCALLSSSLHTSGLHNSYKNRESSRFRHVRICLSARLIYFGYTSQQLCTSGFLYPIHIQCVSPVLVRHHTCCTYLNRFIHLYLDCMTHLDYSTLSACIWISLVLHIWIALSLSGSVCLYTPGENSPVMSEFRAAPQTNGALCKIFRSGVPCVSYCKVVVGINNHAICTYR